MCLVLKSSWEFPFQGAFSKNRAHHTPYYLVIKASQRIRIPLVMPYMMANTHDRQSLRMGWAS